MKWTFTQHLDYVDSDDEQTARGIQAELDEEMAYVAYMDGGPNPYQQEDEDEDEQEEMEMEDDENAENDEDVSESKSDDGKDGDDEN